METYQHLMLFIDLCKRLDVFIGFNSYLSQRKTWSGIGPYNNRNITDISLSNNNKSKHMSYTMLIYEYYLCDEHIKTYIIYYHIQPILM